MQKIRMTADGHKVLLTDSPEEARLSQKNGPVIGICSPGSGKSWSGISFLAEDWDDVDDEYVELAYCRYYHLPRTLLWSPNISWKIREAACKDAAGFAALYEDTQVKQFLAYPLSRRAESLSDWEEWIESQHCYVYPSEEPAMWVLADEHDEFMGRIGLEYKENGYYLGYALLPKWRKKGLAAQAASQLLKFCFEYWQLDNVYLLCSCENIASIKTALACGFSHIRTISNKAFHDASDTSSDALKNVVHDTSNKAFASGTLENIVEHPLNLGSGVGASEFFLFARKAL